ncbi:YHS domain-containing protein [Pseudomonadota bacterium]
MDGLSSFLLFAVLFYVMMRFGCGAHMVHGRHGKHTESKPKDIDPVCGTEIKIEEGYGKMENGTLYRFCSKECLDSFDNNPGQYIKHRVDTTHLITKH